MTDQPCAELPSEIPPVGKRQIRAKAGTVFAAAALVIIHSTICVALFVILLRERSHWSYLLALVGGALVLPACVRQRLAREHRILRIGTPVEGQITDEKLPVLDEGQGWSDPGSIRYRYNDPSGQLRGGKTDYGGGPGDLVTSVGRPT